MSSYVQEESIKSEQEKLKYYTDSANKEVKDSSEGKLIVNLSLKTIAYNVSQTIISIINELLDPENRNVQAVATIFLKEDRMIYLGITFAVLMFSLYILDITG